MTGCAGDNGGSGSTSGSGTGSQPENDNGNVSDVTIRVLRHAGYDADLMQAEFAGFTEQTGIKVEMDTVPYSDLHNKEVVELSSGSSQYDMIAMLNDWVPEYNSAGWLHPLGEYLENDELTGADYDSDDLLPRLLELNTIDDELLALPYKFNTTVFFNRTDLTPEPPATWDDWRAAIATAEQQGIAGVGLSLAPADLPEVYLNLVELNGGDAFSADGTEAAFDSPEGVEALEFLRELVAAAPDGATTRVWDDSASLMAQGATATDLLVPFQSTVVEGPDSKVAGKISYSPLPPATSDGETTSLMTTWNLAIASGSQHPEEAFQLLAYLTSPDVLKRLTADAGGSLLPSRQSLLADPALSEQYPMFPAVLEAADHTWSYPKSVNLSAALNVLAIRLQEAVMSDEDPAAALDDAAAQVNSELGA